MVCSSGFLTVFGMTAKQKKKSVFNVGKASVKHTLFHMQHVIPNVVRNPLKTFTS